VYVQGMALVDVVVVSYNSRDQLRACVEPLSRLDWVNAVVVDNASADGSLEAIADLPVERIARSDNGGFAKGCNEGWRAGDAPFVLFLNPDAGIDDRSLRRLVEVLEGDERLGAAAPRIEHPDGSLTYSLRRFPRLRSTYAQALFLQRLFPRASWSDEVIRDDGAYARAWSPEWVSGACVLVRRSVLEQLGGWDERFFLYCEDVDLCRRLRALGYDIRFDPSSIAVHEGGASAPKTTTLPLLASSRVLYTRIHRSRLDGALDRLGLALLALTHMIASRGGLAVRRAHGRSLLALFGGPQPS
jgi:N-acetylglucosaminyl-diphospho-decaprenol L-rhamnosyltransferase